MYEIEDLKRQVVNLKRELESGVHSNNVSVRKDSHGSMSTLNDRSNSRHPIDDNIIQKTQQIMLQQMEGKYKQEIATLQLELDLKVRLI